MASELELQLKTLPSNPGVYQYFDKEDKILYIGKAKNLKKRVLSYFQKQDHSGKIRVMVSKIVRLETIVVPTEYDALLLENNLIKQHQPRYNSLLKDDKTFPWICIKNEAFPRIFLTRQKRNDKSQYFGPFTNLKIAKTLLELIKSIYPIRTCTLDLKPEKIHSGKFKKCLEFHLGNCLAPCESLQTETAYLADIASIAEMVKGDFSFATKALEVQMKQYAAQLLFEKAQNIKEKLDLLNSYQAKSTVVHPSIHNVDVFGFTSDESSAYINYMRIYKGAIVNSYTSEWKKKLDETDEEILTSSIIELKTRFQSIAKEIFVPFEIDLDIPEHTITLPKIGDKKRIVELSTRNAKFYRMEKLKQVKIVDPERHANRIMAEMKKLLRMPNEPRHIEGFDNSNLQGTHPSSCCVVFKNGKPSKDDYRKYNIKTVEGPNDFASMEEVIYRRYKRLLDENESLPQLILIDGGKGQLSSAMKSLKLLGLEKQITMIGIAKKLEELFFPNDSIPLYLDKTSETLKVLQQVRNESHRFSLKHHRNRRSTDSIKSELDTIKGIGEKTKQTLLKEFKSVKRIKEASEKELLALIGKSKTQIMLNHFEK